MKVSELLRTLTRAVMENPDLEDLEVTLNDGEQTLSDVDLFRGDTVDLVGE